MFQIAGSWFINRNRTGVKGAINIQTLKPPLNMNQVCVKDRCREPGEKRRDLHRRWLRAVLEK
jgi:hypothetical protein